MRMNPIFDPDSSGGLRHADGPGPATDPLRRLIESNLDGLLVVGAGGHVVFANPAAEQLFGRPPGGLHGKPFGYPIGGDERAELDVLVDGRVPRNVEMRVVPFEWELRPCFLASLRDVTDRKRAEKLAQQHRREMQDFLSIILHDLKRPAVSISGLLGLVQSDTAGTLAGEPAENLKLALGECRHMSELIAELSRIAEADAAEPRVEACDPRGLTQDIVDRLADRIRQCGARIELDAPDRRVELARLPIQQSLQNVIENALMHGCPRPGLTVRIRWLLAKGFAQVVVSDEGPGVPAELHSRLFRMFQRGSRTPGHHGKGIGLFAVRRMLQRIGGDVELVSGVQSGAAFALQFPLDDPSDREKNNIAPG